MKICFNDGVNVKVAVMAAQKCADVAETTRPRRRRDALPAHAIVWRQHRAPKQWRHDVKWRARSVRETASDDRTAMTEFVSFHFLLEAPVTRPKPTQTA